MKINIPEISIIESIIGYKTQQWVSQCYFISGLLLKHNIVQGELCYGKYYGSIDQNSFFSNHPLPNHGWIEFNGFIIDPTRWVFENVEPYIYVGQIDRDVYDIGSNLLRSVLRTKAPSFDPTIKSIQIDQPAINFIFSVLLEDKKNENKVSLNQVAWCASLSLQDLAEFALPLFTWMKEHKLSAFAPIDNFNYILKKS